MTTLLSKVTSAFDKIEAKQPDALQDGTIRRITRTGGGPSDPSGGSETTTDYTVRMAVFDFGPDKIDGTNIQAGDFQVVCEAGEVDFTADDLVICDRGTLVIRQLGRIAPAGETVAYEMICRG